MSVAADLHRRISELEHTVRQLEKDKEALYDDLETRLVAKDGSFWFSSTVLADRLCQAENEKISLKEELKKVISERDSYREDGFQIQAAKRASDQISKSEMEKNHALERELAFYKKHCARALEERNLYSYEVEELKRSNLELERNLESSQSKLETILKEKESVETEKEEGLQQIQQLTERLVECARIPELEAQLCTVRQQKAELQTQHDKLQSLYKFLQSDVEGAMQVVDQLKEEKQLIESDLETLTKESSATIETERSKNTDLEQRLLETTAELKKRNTELQGADSRIAAAQAQAEMFKESHQHEVNAARIEAHETIERLKLQLEEIEGLLTRKKAEVRAAVEAKVTAQENASEWESKWIALNKKILDEKNDAKPAKTSVLRRSSLEAGSFRANSNSTPRQHWFRLRSRPSGDSFRSLEPSPESLTNALDLVLGLVPKLKSIYESLESAEPKQTGSRRESLSRLDAVRQKTTELQKELESYPMSPHLDDSAGRFSAHVTVGMEAVHLAFYCIARLKQFINVAH